MLPHFENISFQVQGVVWIIWLQQNFLLSFNSNFSLKSSQLFILPLFSKRFFEKNNDSILSLFMYLLYLINGEAPADKTFWGEGKNFRTSLQFLGKILETF